MLVHLVIEGINFTKINAMKDVQEEHTSHLQVVPNAKKGVMCAMSNTVMSVTRVQDGN